MQSTLIIGLIFALFIAVFSIQNAVPVSLTFFTWKFNTSLVVVVLGSVAIGALVMGLFAYVKQFKMKREINKLKVQNRELESENEELTEIVAENEEVKDNEFKDKENNSQEKL